MGSVGLLFEDFRGMGSSVVGGREGVGGMSKVLGSVRGRGGMFPQ